jgi:hypothetical protein
MQAIAAARVPVDLCEQLAMCASVEQGLSSADEQERR